MLAICSLTPTHFILGLHLGMFKCFVQCNSVLRYGNPVVRVLTVRSSSSELKRLSRSLMDTTRSVSWIRLVVGSGLLPAEPWASVCQQAEGLLKTSRDISLHDNLQHNTDTTLFVGLFVEKVISLKYI